MNPFSDIVKVDKNRNLQDSRLITVGSTCGGGKTTAIHTMILNYIKSGVNVILFSETYEHSTEAHFHHIQMNFKKETMGILVTFPLFLEDTIESFNIAISNRLEFLKGTSVIVIDCPMFNLQNNSFSYKKFKNENTRFVIVEKYPEKEIWIQSGEVMVKTMYINIKLIPPVKHIELNITIDKDGKIQQ
jgi:hypothetical protein